MGGAVLCSCSHLFEVMFMKRDNYCVDCLESLVSWRTESMGQCTMRASRCHSHIKFCRGARLSLKIRHQWVITADKMAFPQWVTG